MLTKLLDNYVFDFQWNQNGLGNGWVSNDVVSIMSALKVMTIFDTMVHDAAEE